MTNQSYDSANITTAGIVTPGAYGQKRIRLPNLEKTGENKVNVSVPKGSIDYR